MHFSNLLLNTFTRQFPFGTELGGKTILALMVLYNVYGLMSPITAYFTLLIFGALAIGFRNQFIYIYPLRNDSGGELASLLNSFLVVFPDN